MLKNSKFQVILLRTVAALLVLVVLSTGMVAGRFARYTTTASSGDGAKVAKYHITVDSASDNAVTLAPDVPASYSFSVTSSSEVAVAYDLVITLPKKLPDGISLSLTKGENTDVLTSGNGIYTVTDAGNFGAQGGTDTYTLTFTAEQPIGADKLEGIAIRVDARQMD